jgi:hypothetical protein
LTKPDPPGGSKTDAVPGSRPIPSEGATSTPLPDGLDGAIDSDAIIPAFQPGINDGFVAKSGSEMAAENMNRPATPPANIVARLR